MEYIHIRRVTSVILLVSTSGQPCSILLMIRSTRCHDASPKTHLILKIMLHGQCLCRVNYRNSYMLFVL